MHFASERELAESHYDVPTLLAHPKIGPFVKWVSTQSRRQRTAQPRDRRRR